MQISKVAEQLLPKIYKAFEEYPQHSGRPAAIIKIDQQKIYVFNNDQLICEYPVSTSRFGIGQTEGSYKTPLGIHYVKEKIGDGAEHGEIFKGRERTYSCAMIEYEKKPT